MQQNIPEQPHIPQNVYPQVNQQNPQIIPQNPQINLQNPQIIPQNPKINPQSPQLIHQNAPQINTGRYSKGDSGRDSVPDSGRDSGNNFNINILP